MLSGRHNVNISITIVQKGSCNLYWNSVEQICQNLTGQSETIYQKLIRPGAFIAIQIYVYVAVNIYT